MADTKKEVAGSDTVPEIHRGVDPSNLPPHDPQGAAQSGQDPQDGPPPKASSRARSRGGMRAEGYGSVKGVGGAKGPGDR